MKDSTSWGNVANWYDALLEQDNDSYQQKVVLPNLLRLMDIKPGEIVADIACGQGFFSRIFHAAKASVIAIDVSSELVEIAKKKSSPEIRFFVSPSDNLSMIQDSSVDKAVIVLAIQNIEKYSESLKEVTRILRPQGKLYFVLNHPTFRIPKKSSWEFDDKANFQFRRVDEYLSESRSEIDMEPGKGGVGEKTVSFHRPLQAYSKALQKAGFAILRMEEWVSHKESQKGPRQVAEDRARREIPLFLCIEAVKLQ